MNQPKFIIWKAWIALPVVGLMLMFLYLFEALGWLSNQIKDFFFYTATGAYGWALSETNQPHEFTSH